MNSQGISTGLKALIAAQSSLDTIGNNLSNINTPGYSRQRVDLVQALGIQRNGLRIGTGVDALEVTRAVDNLIESRILGQLGLRAQIAERYVAAQEIEFTLGEFDGTGVGAAFDKYFAAAKQLAGDPSDKILRNNLVQGGVHVAERFNQVSAGLGALGSSVADSLRSTVSEANALTDQIAALNRQIRTLEPGGDPANELRDERQVAVQALAKLARVDVREDADGTYRIYLEGNMVVAADRAMPLTTTIDSGGKASLHVKNSSQELLPQSGRLSALLALQDQELNGLTSDLDKLAKGLIYAVNSAHSVGIPSGGGYSSLVGSNALQDLDGDGQVGDQLLASSGLPFDLKQGELTVNLVEQASGEVQTYKLEIDPLKTTVDDFLAALNDLPGLTADLNSEKHLTIVAEPGLKFDFSNRLDPNPASAGTLGGGQAKLGSANAGPYNLSSGGTLDFAVPAGASSNLTLTIAPGDFDNPASVDAEELADWINAQTGFSAAGLEAHAVAGYLHFTSAGSGANQSFSLNSGTAAQTLGFAGVLGQANTGTDLAAAIAVSGAYTGSESKSLKFEVSGSGTVGTTAGLALEVYDDAGALVSTLNIGAGYQPGSTLAVIDGIEITVSLGQLSESSNERFELSATADSDSSDVLVAVGWGGFFVGQDADTIAVRSDLVDNPDAIASSWSGTSGGNQALLALGQIAGQPLDLLDGRTLNSSYGEMVAGLGFDLASMEVSLGTADKVLESLQQRRDSVSGVNADEELVDLTRFQQAYATAAQYLSIVSRLGEELLAIL
jgi:flagellar hook-associated protein 1